VHAVISKAASLLLLPLFSIILLAAADDSTNSANSANSAIGLDDLILLRHSCGVVAFVGGMETREIGEYTTVVAPSKAPLRLGVTVKGLVLQMKNAADELQLRQRNVLLINLFTRTQI
jgi:hypothetical protein